jgi:acetolactate synthase I/III small subunit
MQKNMHKKVIFSRSQAVVLELTVNNHPGVMSHICGLFSRRAYNLEKILCLPDKDGQLSRMWLQVNEEERFEQVVKQLQKLEDVRKVTYYPKGYELFAGIEAVLNA